MGFLAFIQRKTQKLSQPQRKAPPYECRLSPKSPVRLVHPAGPTISRNDSTYSHRPRPDRAALFPAHGAEPRSYSSPGLPLPRLGDNTKAVPSRPRSSLTSKISQTDNTSLMLSHRPHTALSNRRLSFTSTRRSHIDLLDAQSEFAAPDFYGRVRASGVRDYGEDVADRNITVNGFNLGPPLSKTFSFRSTVTDTTARTPHRHALLSSRTSMEKKNDHNIYGRPETAPNLPRLAIKKSTNAFSISSFATESLAELDVILPSEMESNHAERERTVSHNSLRLENNNSTDSFACPPAIRRSSGSRVPGRRSLLPNMNGNMPLEAEENQLRAVSSSRAPSILFSAAEAGPPNKRPMESHTMPYDGQGIVPYTMRCLETFLNSDDEDDVLKRQSEDTTSSPASSLRHWATAPLTPTSSSSNSDSTLRTLSRQTGNTSVDSSTSVVSSAVSPEPGSVSFDQLQMALAKEANPDKKQAPGPLSHDSAFNMDDYLPDDESLLGCEEQPESEDLLFTPSYGEFELPGLQNIFMTPASSNLLRSLEERVKAKPSDEDDINSECPSLDGSKRRRFDAHRGGHRPVLSQSAASGYDKGLM